jgi:quinol monooxygenase YgiN
MADDSLELDWTLASCMFLWEYKVLPEQISEFEAHYGPSGKWAQLFENAEGYIRSELLRDGDDPMLYRAAEYWTSRDAFLNFLRDYSVPYDELHKICDGLSASQTNLGVFLVTA